MHGRPETVVVEAVAWAADFDDIGNVAAFVPPTAPRSMTAATVNVGYGALLD